jgi:DNA-binding IclR family transcriptional regulator
VAVAAPFFDRTGKVAGSLGVFGPEARWDDARLKDLGTELAKYAAEVSAALGFTG